MLKFKPIYCKCNHRRAQHDNALSFWRINVGRCSECICQRYKPNTRRNWSYYDNFYFGILGVVILGLTVLNFTPTPIIYSHEQKVLYLGDLLATIMTFSYIGIIIFFIRLIRNHIHWDYDDFHKV